MAIASKGSMGVGASSTSNASYAMTTATTILAVGNIGILTSISDNSTTTDGDNSEVTSVTDSVGNIWTKLGEYTNSPGGVAGDGVTCSVWMTKCTVQLATGGTITINFNGNRTDKCCSCWAYTIGTGKVLVPAAPLVTSEVNAANGFGSSAFSSLVSLSRLYFRGLGKEVNSTTDITVSASFTAITLTRSRNNASAVIVRGEFRINTSTGETSNPTLAVSGDTAGLFFALDERTPADFLPSYPDKIDERWRALPSGVLIPRVQL